MTKYRCAAKIDANQPGIVETLRSIPGVTVEVEKDDILVGRVVDGVPTTFWFEIKTPECVGKNGQVMPSKIKPSQVKLLEEFTGHYQIVWNVKQIFEAIGL